MKNILRVLFVTLVLGGGIFGQKSVSPQELSCCCPQTPIYISGRVTDGYGIGLRSVKVTAFEVSLRGDATFQHSVFTNAFGYYLIDSHTCEWTLVAPMLPRGAPLGANYTPQQNFSIIQDYYTIKDFTYNP